MISQTAEYALRAVVYLACHSEELATTQQIAEATRVPVHYLSKVLQSLARAGMINSQRGLNGGFSLIKPPGEYTIYEIIQAVDPLQRIRTCPLGIASHGINLCALHRRLDDAMEMVERTFKQTTLAELMSDSNESKMLCEIAQNRD